MTDYLALVSRDHVDFDLGESQQLNMAGVSEARIIFVSCGSWW